MNRGIAFNIDWGSPRAGIVFKSSSSSSSSNSTEQSDERIAASDSAVVIRFDSDNDFTINDSSPQVVQSIADGFETLVNGAGEVLEDLLSFTAEQNTEERELVGKALDIAEARTQSEDANNLQTFLKWGTVAAVSYAAVKVVGPKVFK